MFRKLFTCIAISFLFIKFANANIDIDAQDTLMLDAVNSIEIGTDNVNTTISIGTGNATGDINIGNNNEPIKISDLAKTIKNITKSESEITYLPFENDEIENLLKGLVG